MAADEHLGYQFSSRPVELNADDYSPGGPGKRTAMMQGDKEIGYAEHTDEGFVQWLEVQPEHRRKGAGRALLKHIGAKDTSGFTDEGEALWKAK